MFSSVSRFAAFSLSLIIFIVKVPLISFARRPHLSAYAPVICVFISAPDSIAHNTDKYSGFDRIDERFCLGHQEPAGTSSVLLVEFYR